ncbi:MAG: hypothetical protein HQ591_13175 [candidate division Zixibacteria bacterium]|nr:hypothetical protein [Candidatus Tariuqbacter arcticus]
MSDTISLNSLQREAKPFWLEKPFINPDKAILKPEMPFTQKYRDTFSFQGFKQGGVFSFGGLNDSLLKMKNHLSAGG